MVLVSFFYRLEYSSFFLLKSHRLSSAVFVVDFVICNVYVRFLTCCQNFSVQHTQARCNAT